MFEEEIPIYKNEKFVRFTMDSNKYHFYVITSSRKFFFQLRGEVQCCEMLSCGFDEEKNDDNEDQKEITDEEMGLKNIIVNDSTRFRMNFIIKLRDITYTFWVENKDKSGNYAHDVRLTDYQQVNIKTCV